jgi:hypothetical protein
LRAIDHRTIPLQNVEPENSIHLDLISRLLKPGGKRLEINQRDGTSSKIFVANLEIADMSYRHDAVIHLDLSRQFDHFGLTGNTKRIGPVRIYDSQGGAGIDGEPCRTMIDPNWNKKMIAGGSAQ